MQSFSACSMSVYLLLFTKLLCLKNAVRHFLLLAGDDLYPSVCVPDNFNYLNLIGNSNSLAANIQHVHQQFEHGVH